MADQLILGGIVFQNFDYSPPTRIGPGGKQAMVVHKLPGGSRVIDTLGPDEDDISWDGFFFCNTALVQCQRLDAMRAAGLVVTLQFGGMTRQVVVNTFKYHIRRYPNWCEYQLSCTVSANPMFGTLGGAVTASTAGAIAGAAATVDALISADLATAAAAATE